VLEPALQRCAVDAYEVSALATDNGEPRLVGPLVEDLLAHLAELGGLGPCEHTGGSGGHSDGESSRTSPVKVSQDPLYDVIAGTAISEHRLICATLEPSIGTDSLTDALATTRWGSRSRLSVRRVTNLDLGRWARFPVTFVRWRLDRSVDECGLEQLS
jgi:hypothetical protein